LGGSWRHEPNFPKISKYNGRARGVKRPPQSLSTASRADARFVSSFLLLVCLIIERAHPRRQEGPPQATHCGDSRAGGPGHQPTQFTGSSLASPTHSTVHIARFLAIDLHALELRAASLELLADVVRLGAATAQRESAQLWERRLAVEEVLL